ncbi:hypothetical protein Pelo_15189 [Pelomyxa schiedti]|nr:hypothetical protein Pelo_15189 [Pelomyxa schiedti]
MRSQVDNPPRTETFCIIDVSQGMKWDVCGFDDERGIPRSLLAPGPAWWHLLGDVMIGPARKDGNSNEDFIHVVYQKNEWGSALCIRGEGYNFNTELKTSEEGGKNLDKTKLPMTALSSLSGTPEHRFPQSTSFSNTNY